MTTLTNTSAFTVAITGDSDCRQRQTNPFVYRQRVSGALRALLDYLKVRFPGFKIKRGSLAIDPEARPGSVDALVYDWEVRHEPRTTVVTKSSWPVHAADQQKTIVSTETNQEFIDAMLKDVSILIVCGGGDIAADMIGEARKRGIHSLILSPSKLFGLRRYHKVDAFCANILLADQGYNSLSAELNRVVDNIFAELPELAEEREKYLQQATAISGMPPAGADGDWATQLPRLRRPQALPGTYQTNCGTILTRFYASAEEAEKFTIIRKEPESSRILVQKELSFKHTKVLDPGQHSSILGVLFGNKGFGPLSAIGYSKMDAEREQEFRMNLEDYETYTFKLLSAFLSVVLERSRNEFDLPPLVFGCTDSGIDRAIFLLWKSLRAAGYKLPLVGVTWGGWAKYSVDEEDVYILPCATREEYSRVFWHEMMAGGIAFCFGGAEHAFGKDMKECIESPYGSRIVTTKLLSIATGSQVHATSKEGKTLAADELWNEMATVARARQGKSVEDTVVEVLDQVLSRAVRDRYLDTYDVTNLM